MATSYFCAECNYETDDKHCPLCNEKTEQLNVKDDPLFGTVSSNDVYAYQHEDQPY